MHESFGARLRRRREEQHIALATIAEKTKIKQSLLEALERDDVSHWPTGIFRRAFIRSYATAIRADVDAVVREFLELFPEPTEVVTTAGLSAAADAARGTATQPGRFRALFSRRRQVEDPVTSAPMVTPERAGIFNVVPIEPGAAVNAPELPIAGEPNPLEQALDAISASARVPPPAERVPDLVALADLCTRFARVESSEEIRPLLEDAASILGATGMVVWLWSPDSDGLRPALAHGYSDRVLARLPNVKRDADNLTAVAFRSGERAVIDAQDRRRSAVAIPLLAPLGCSGVLALEFADIHNPQLVAAATIVAAQLSQLIGAAEPALEEHSDESFAPPVLRLSAGA